MKSLSISTATFAVAMSLATSAQANTGAPHIAPEMDTLLFADTSVDGAAGTDGAFDEGAVPAVELVQPSTDAHVMTIAPLSGPVAIEVDAQNAIHSAAFTNVEGNVTLNIAPVAASPRFAIGSVLQAPLSTDRVVTASNLTPNYGDIDAFWGDIVAFYGDIDAFWGDISPFYGDISPFWDDISPFYGDIDAFWGDIDAFWGDIVAFDRSHLESLGNFGQQLNTQIGATEADWSALRYSVDSAGNVSIVYDGTPNRIRGEFETLIAQAEAQFGAAYTARTGQSFREGFVAEILARHGIDISDTTTGKETLAKTEAERAAFFLDWYDSLNQYSGIDAVDHWMAAINWTPQITQIQAEARTSVIGIIDGSFAADGDLGNNVVYSGGSTHAVGGHGAGVASLIAGAHDGQGVMGIAPDAHLVTYNPFDADNTASWDSVANGIQQLLYAYVGGNDTGYASIINLSLGESGWTLSQGMADVLARPGISAWHGETTYVIAAGNDGISQTADINWDYSRDANLLVVGSVDPNGEISSFSNRPGSACLLDNGACHAGNELMNRFIVAPGSLILVSDGNGGVVRRSGTSFAAPLVSGAISLLHDRWPWLARHPEESVEIILRTAQDLGAPGVDEVYGHGLLDVTASQSPLNFNELSARTYRRVGASYVATNVSVSSLLDGGLPAWWELDNAYLTATENIGNTYRDFAIPLSSFQYGKSTNSLGNGYQRFQDFVGDRFANWLLSGGTDTNGDGKAGVSQIRSNQTQTQGQWTMRYDAIAPRFTQDGAVRPVHNAATLTDPKGTMSFTLGHGQGALALAGTNFGIISDHDPVTGGVNPVLGFASGELFAGAGYKVAPGTKLTVGYSSQREDADDLSDVNELDRLVQQQLGAREAEAITVGLEQKVTDNFTINAQWTHLVEDDAILGAQTGVDALLGEGSRTDAMTVTANMDFGDGVSFDLSVTGGATETAEGQLLATNGRAISTAGQFAVNKRGVMNSRDILRVSVGQPLTVEQGELELRSDTVVDRLTGELGATSQFIGISTQRRYTGEIVYATPVTQGSELGIIGRYVSAGGQGEEESFMIGANFGLRF